MIHAKRIRYTREDIAFNVISYSVITLLILVCLYPIWYVACASITDPRSWRRPRVFCYGRRG